jgi:hypothetical protein
LPVPNWSRPLPRPIIISDVLTLEMLADVRTLVEKHLPAEYCSKFSWRPAEKLFGQPCNAEDARTCARRRQALGGAWRRHAGAVKTPVFEIEGTVVEKAGAGFFRVRLDGTDRI